jgi:MscS family membrane protein
MLFENLPPDIRNVLLRVLAVILALLVIWILRHALRWLLVKPLKLVAARTNTRFDDLLLEASAVPVRLIIMALALVTSLRILDVSSRFLEQIAGTLVIVALLILFNRAIDVLVSSNSRIFAMTGVVLNERLVPFVRVASRLVLIAVGIVVILQEWGYDITGLVAGIGFTSLGLSLAAQDTVANIFGFMAIVGDRPFNVGEYIKTPDVEGIVEHVGLRSTRVRQLDQAVVVVPNNKLANSAILNWSRLSKRRIDYILAVRYGTASNEIRYLLERIREYLKEQETVEADSVVVNLINFGNDSLEILVRAYVNLADWGAFTAEKERLHLGVIDIVHEMGMTIAIPSQTLYVREVGDLLPRERMDGDRK